MREAKHYLQGKSLIISAGFPAENIQARRDWQCIFKVLKGKKVYSLQSGILYLTILLFIFEGQIKSFPEKQI